jgi:group I intron endonuclease
MTAITRAIHTIPRTFAVSGIYGIQLTRTKRYYVGSSVDLRERLGIHCRQLATGTHHAHKLQYAWLKYGPERFVFHLLERVGRKTLLVEREQYWLDKLSAFSAGFNTRPRAEANYDMVWSDDQNQRRREANTKAWCDPQLRKALSDRFKGQHRGEWTEASRRQAGEAGKRAHTRNPERAQRFGKATREAWSDPAQRRARVEAISRGIRQPEAYAARLKQLEAARRSPNWLAGVRRSGAKRRGVTAPPGKMAHRCARLYAKGLSTREVAAKLGISHKTVAADLRKLGVTIEKRYAKGSRSGTAKLTEAKVRRIRAALAAGQPVSVLADRYGVSTTTVSNIRTGKIWGHVKL